MASKERAVLLRSLGTNSGKFYFPKNRGPHFQGPRLREGKCLARRQKPKSNFPEFLSSVPPTGVDRIRQAVLYKGDMTREWSGCERRATHPPAAIAFPTAGRCVRRRRFVLLRRACQHTCPTPTILSRRPARRSRPSGRPVSRSRRAGTVQTRHRQAAHRSGEVPLRALQVRKRPAAGATDGQNVSQEHMEDAATGRLHKWPVTDGLRRQGAGSAFGRVRACGVRRPVPVGIAAFRQEAPAARPASCAPRPHCERPGRHCAA